jgi:hypothetical protein
MNLRKVPIKFNKHEASKKLERIVIQRKFAQHKDNKVKTNGRLIQVR